MRILLIALELPLWHKARSLSYCAQLAFEEGLKDQGIDYFTITTPWLRSVKEILQDKKFDQVWVELTHSHFNEELLEWLSQLAPVRVGFILESLDYSADEQAVLPFLKERRGLVEKKIKYLTHVITCDEKDADNFNVRHFIPALWWPQAVPRRFIGTAVSEKAEEYATFSGALYGARTHWLNHEHLKEILVRQTSSEQGTFYPALFNVLHGVAFISSKSRLSINAPILSGYLNSLRYIRRNCFSLWLKKMRTGCAVINLPHFVKTYAGRVVEGMAAGRPVISWEIPDRPKNKALFQTDQEILLFDKDHPEQLAIQIRRILSDRNLNRKIVTNAFKKIESFHTIEKRVEQIIKWIEKGQAPTYG